MFQAKWTEAEDTELKRLVMMLPQISYSAIGKRMGKGKNACIGRARRIGLPERGFFRTPSSLNMPRPERLRVVRQRKPRRKTRRPAIPVPPPPPAPPLECPVDHVAKTLVELQPEDCRYLFGTGLYCGAQIMAGQVPGKERPYCDEHHAVVYQPMRRQA